MDNRNKAILFAVLAAFMAASSAVFAANTSIPHIFIVAPLVVMGVLLFVAGYFSGLTRR